MCSRESVSIVCIDGSRNYPGEFYTRASEVPTDRVAIDIELANLHRVREISEQDFHKLRDVNFSQGSLFEDPLFDAIDTNVYYSKDKFQKFNWKRPKELFNNPKFVTDGVSRFDVNQGRLDNCWFVAAMASIAMNPALFHKVVPADQGFQYEDKYAGIFHFRFWRFGEWVDFVVDDRLPANYGLVFSHSRVKNEFWSALLEKAYAKLHGSFEALIFGLPSEALMDLSGGVLEKYYPPSGPSNLFAIMRKAHERSSMLCCTIYGSGSAITMPSGLVSGHVYTVTNIAVVTVQTSPPLKVELVRLRNPWGNDIEWKGAWSDKSPEWETISNEEKNLLKPVVAVDGEFWMPFSDFKKHFSDLEICHITPDVLYDDGTSSRKQWQVKQFHNTWVMRSNAGGSRNYMNTFATNPQYRVKLNDPDEDDDDKKCTLIIAIMQKYDRNNRKKKIVKYSIGFGLYYVKNPESVPDPAPRKFFEYNRDLVKHPIFSFNREVNQRFKLLPGTYCIVPSTFYPNNEADFLLRVFTEKKSWYDLDVKP